MPACSMLPLLLSGVNGILWMRRRQPEQLPALCLQQQLRRSSLPQARARLAAAVCPHHNDEWGKGFTPACPIDPAADDAQMLQRCSVRAELLTLEQRCPRPRR